MIGCWCITVLCHLFWFISGTLVNFPFCCTVYIYMLLLLWVTCVDWIIVFWWFIDTVADIFVYNCCRADHVAWPRVGTALNVRSKCTNHGAFMITCATIGKMRRWYVPPAVTRMWFAMISHNTWGPSTPCISGPTTKLECMWNPSAPSGNCLTAFNVNGEIAVPR